MPRPRKCRRVGCLPRTNLFVPHQCHHDHVIVMSVDEFETIRLIDYENLSQEECGKLMQIGRTTVQMIYGRARNKIAKALVDSCSLKIEGGDYILGDAMPEHHCCQSHCDNKNYHLNKNAHFEKLK